MLTIESQCDYKPQHECRQYSYYVIISVIINDDNTATMWS